MKKYREKIKNRTEFVESVRKDTGEKKRNKKVEIEKIDCGSWELNCSENWLR